MNWYIDSDFPVSPWFALLSSKKGWERYFAEAEVGNR